MDELEKIKDRIAKLLRMANDSSSPEEAAIAMRREREVLQITSSVTVRALVLAKKSRVEEKFGKVQYEARKSEEPESIAVLIARIDGQIAGDRVQIFKGIDNE